MGEKGLSMRPNGVPWQLKSLQQCQESGHILRFWLRITSSKDVIEQEVVPTPREELARQVRARLGLPAGHQDWESGTQKQGRFCFNIKVQFSSVQSLSCVWLFATTWTTAHQAFLSITNSRSQEIFFQGLFQRSWSRARRPTRTEEGKTTWTSLCSVGEL